jgi:hypothetical protein
MCSCECGGWPEAFYLDHAPVGWSESLDELASGSWKTLRRCRNCDEAFAVDAWDKYQEQVVVRVAERATWEQRAECLPLRRSLLLQSRGGLEGESCICRGCSSPRVRGIAYCLEHLWETGARR